MGIIDKLNKSKDSFVTLKKLSINDLLINKVIGTLLENKNVIIEYFNEKYEYEIESSEDYLDFLYLEYITNHSEFIEKLLEPHSTLLSELIDFSKLKLQSFSKKNIIKFISANYHMIFNYDNEQLEDEMDILTLMKINQFKKGINNLDEIVSFLIVEKVFLCFDNLFQIEHLIDSDKLKEFLITEENFKKITKYRFENYCNLILKFGTSKKYNDLTNSLCDKLFDYCYEISESEDLIIYDVHSKLNIIFEVLYKNKYSKIDEVKELKEKYDEKVDLYLQENGEEYVNEYTSTKYYELIKKLESIGIKDFEKYLTFTHIIEEDKKKFISQIEVFSRGYESSLIDFVGSARKTNDYFTLGRMNQTTNFILSKAINIQYWFDSEEKINIFRKNLKFSINEILTKLNIERKSSALNADIDSLIDIVKDLNNFQKKPYFPFVTKFYLIAFLEKMLRIIYLEIESILFFDEGSQTLKVFLGDKNYVNEKMEKLIGNHLIKWLRFYFSYDEYGIGKDYRNKIAHFYEIELKDINIAEIFVLFYLIISAINSIYINIPSYIIDEKQEKIV